MVDTAPTITAPVIKIPTLCLEEGPEDWLFKCEAIFEKHNVVESKTKYSHAIRGLPTATIVGSILDVMRNPPALNPYRRLRWAVLKQLGKGVKQEPAEEEEVIELSSVRQLGKGVKQEPAKEDEDEVIDVISDDDEHEQPVEIMDDSFTDELLRQLELSSKEQEASKGDELLRQLELLYKEKEASKGPDQPDNSGIIAADNLRVRLTRLSSRVLERYRTPEDVRGEPEKKQKKIPRPYFLLPDIESDEDALDNAAEGLIRDLGGCKGGTGNTAITTGNTASTTIGSLGGAGNASSGSVGGSEGGTDIITSRSFEEEAINIASGSRGGSGGVASFVCTMDNNSPIHKYGYLKWKNREGGMLFKYVSHQHYQLQEQGGNA